jgi:hypothetical protein
VNETSLANWTAQVTELRTVIDTIRAYVNNWDSNNTIHDIPAISWIPITVNCPTVAVMNQVRDAITTI